MSTPQSETGHRLFIYRPSTAVPLAVAVDEFLSAHVDPSAAPQDAAAALGDIGAKTIALLSAPKWFSFGKVEITGSECRIAVPGSVPISEAYEARVFLSRAELRWYRPQGQTAGTAVWLADERLPAPGIVAPDIVPCVCTLPQTYLLWGRGMQDRAPPGSGWSWLAEHRIRRMAVPLAALSAHDRVQLCAVEYLRADDRGNVSVVNERFTGLQIHRVN